MSDEDESVGKGRPPKQYQWPTGTSGNPGGGPRGKRKKEPAHGSFLDQEVTVVENGVEARMTAEEAFLLFIVSKGTQGDIAVAQMALEALERNHVTPSTDQVRNILITRYPNPYDPLDVMRIIGMARLLDPHRDSAHWAIEPWLVEAALERFGERRLTLKEQETVLLATRAPKKVQWPEWWSARPT